MPAAMIAEIIADECLMPRELVKPEATLESLGLDSLDAVSLALSIEADFGMKISDEDMTAWKTVGDVIECVSEKVNAGSHASETRRD